MNAPVVCRRRPTSTWTECRCEECRARNSRLRKMWEAGVLPASRAGDAAELLARLVAQGWSSTAIASASGISRRTLDRQVVRARAGERVLLHRHTADLILSMGAPTAGFVGAAGPSRRLQGLARMGWTLDDLAAETGLPFSTLAVIRQGTRSQTAARAATLIAAVYDRLCMVPGPSPVTAVYARSQGWVPPLAWDDDTIDDPTASPEGVQDRDPDAAPVNARKVHVDDIVEQLELDPAAPLRVVAERLGLRKETIRRHLHRHGRDDLLAVMSRNAVAAGCSNQHTSRSVAA